MAERIRGPSGGSGGQARSGGRVSPELDKMVAPEVARVWEESGGGSARGWPPRVR